MSLLTLPTELREDLKDPLGPIFEDPEELLKGAGEPIIAVGDVVTYHLRRAGRDPDVSVIDGKTKRHEVANEVAEVLEGDDPRIRVHNPAGELTEEMLRALREAIDRDEPTVIHVEGEEDLVTLPAIVAAPLDTSVVYGQPNVGMVHVTTDAEAKQVARDLISRMDGDSETAFELLES